jgi:hypothetical protein
MDGAVFLSTDGAQVGEALSDHSYVAFRVVYLSDYERDFGLIHVERGDS